MTMRPAVYCTFASILFAGLCCALTARAEDPVQGNALLKTDILGVFAHPDDETGMASTLAHYALGEGKTILHAYCTRGEGGGNMVGTHYGPSLGIMRELELRDCLTQLGVRHWYFLGQLDFAYTESIWATLNRWDKEGALEQLVRIIRNHRPEIVLTMNPAPRPGQHGHHQAAGVLATEAVRLAADPEAFPLQIQREGIDVWQVRKLYYGGAMGNHQAQIESTAVVRDGLTAGQIAGQALSHHRSQGFGRMRGAAWLQLPRTFSLVHSVVPFLAEESDLFRGLDFSPDHLTPGLVQPPASDTADGDDVSIRFVTRPAIERYMVWAKEQGIEHVSQAFEADLPVVAGEWNDVALDLGNVGSATVEGELRLTMPKDWMVDPQWVPFTIKPGLNLGMTIRVKPPKGLPEDGTIQLTAKYDGKESSAEANLHPVPTHRIARIAEGGLDWESPFWSRVVPITILPEHRVQGESTGLADSSAQIKMAHDRSAFYVQIDVNDDQVVSNIAPNDIRGHWRSDSVEFCLDAKGGSEDSFSTYKLGVFPFDAAGQVRAARDADANQGPVEETAPGTEMTSERTDDGYRLRLKIPFDEVGEGIESGSRMGFNVIIYDGDKADASPGENINESRLAWAPRSGVQGRPEDWGRIDLE
jgi:LmbE family N-acetylglucosaminyl deacetylase